MTPWVLVTRSEDETVELAAALKLRGIAVAPYPVLVESDHDDAAGWAAAVREQSRLRWIALTSGRAPRAFRRQAMSRGMWSELLALPTAAVGEATATAARACGLTVRLVGRSGGRELAESVLAELRPGDAVLHPCGRDRRPELEAALDGGGARAVPVAVYAMELAETSALPELPGTPPVGVVVTSPRAAEAYLRAVGNRYAAVPHLALGGSTQRAAGAAGLQTIVVATPTSQAVVEEICRISS
jgi:uroporphyrinogen-III synthase